MSRTARTAWIIGALAGATGWAWLFLRAPGVALEILLLLSPLVVAGWLIVTLTPIRSRVTPLGRRPHPAPRSRSVEGARCATCQLRPATRLVARGPLRASGEATLALCDACAAGSPLARSQRQDAPS